MKNRENLDAKLYFYYGAMGSGKTAHALMTAHMYKERGFKVELFKPAIDTRNGANFISSRAGLSAQCLSLETLCSTRNAYLHKQVEVIIVDESQFATAEQIDRLSDIVDNTNIPVLCYGLKTDFKGNLFEGSKRLLELADKIIELPAMCHCGRNARFNLRIDSFGNAVTDGAQIELGGDARYMSVCRQCYKAKTGDSWRSKQLPKESPMNDAEVEAARAFIERNAVDEGFLYQWYIHSVDTEDEPQWTEKHLAELCGDFVVVPKPAVSKEPLEFNGFICTEGDAEVHPADIMLVNRIMKKMRK